MIKGVWRVNGCRVQPPTVRLVSQWKWSFSCSFNFYQMKIEWKITKDCRHFCLLSEEKLFGFNFFSFADWWQEQLCCFKFLFSCSRLLFIQWFCPHPLSSSIYSIWRFYFPPLSAFDILILLGGLTSSCLSDIVYWPYFFNFSRPV